MRRVHGTKIVAAVLAGAMVTLGASACGSDDDKKDKGSDSGSKGGMKVGLAFDVGGLGDKSFNDSANAGLERAKKEQGVDGKLVEANQGEGESDRINRLELLAKTGYDMVIAVGFAYSTSAEKVAPKYPKVKFAVVDGIPPKQPIANLTALTFAEEQGSFLVGAAAALKSKTGKIGFIGGMQGPLIKKFEAGYLAGAKAAKPSIQIVGQQYLGNTPDAFNNPTNAKQAATGQYDKGADVIYHASGRSGIGVFQAAEKAKKFAIGVDSDQYLTASAGEKPYILTSMLKRVDNAVVEFVKGVKGGNVKTGEWKFDLSVDGVGYSTANEKEIKEFTEKLDGYKKKIADGEIKVPTTPQG